MLSSSEYVWRGGKEKTPFACWDSTAGEEVVLLLTPDWQVLHDGRVIGLKDCKQKNCGINTGSGHMDLGSYDITSLL